MPSFEVSKLQSIGGVRALAETDTRAIDPRRAAGASVPGGPANEGIRLEVNPAIDAATPPVDNDRVVLIREALRDGNYPLVPAKIADEMIAAQLRPVIEP